MSHFLKNEESPWIYPIWFEGSALSKISSLMSTRLGGCSVAPWGSLNLGVAVGDAAAAVASNRQVFQNAMGAVPVFMKQVHGARVTRLVASHAVLGAPTLETDACVTTELGLACTVQVADCLPVLFAAPQGRAVGSAHAGWRGLAAGVLEATLHQVCELAHCEAHEVQAWLGPCIGPHQFEVGLEVLQAFGSNGAAYFKPISTDKWLANLPGLAAQRLGVAGVHQISGGQWCTVQEASRFFSFRRDGITGRMAAAIWITGH
jgi:polyphenol oxidase